MTDETPATPAAPATPKAADTPPQPETSANQGVVQGQVGGAPRGDQTEFELHETALHSDKVITDHDDPLGTKYQFLGAEDPTPLLPIGGAGHDPRTPDEVFAGVAKS